MTSLTAKGLLMCGMALALVACAGSRSSSPTAPDGMTAARSGDGAVSAKDADPADPKPQDGEEKVTICHVPPGNPENAHDITIGASAVPAHLANHEGDHVGPCSPPA